MPTWWRDASTVLGWSVLLFVTALWVHGGGITDLTSLKSGLTTTGRLTGLISAALLLIQTILMARVPFIEQAYGQDALTRTHRTVGFWSFNLMVAHIVLITLGYAAGTQEGILGTLWSFLVDYPGMLLAFAGTAALIMVVVTSIKKARAKLRYESWHLIHLYAYLGVGLAIPHQLWSGGDFVANPVATAFWWGLYAVTMLSVLVFRVVLPLVRNARHQLVVTNVIAESPTVTSVVVQGRNLDRLPVRAGQFFQWRFRDGNPGWTRSHPYSISAAPDGRSLRITVAHLGDGSAQLAGLRPGARAYIEGPYGRLHAGVRTKEKVTLLASGIGITPLRALLEELPAAPGDITLIYRVGNDKDLVLRDEITALAAAKGARVMAVVGHRVRDRASWLPEHAAHLTDAEALRQLSPDMADSDVYICGQTQWMAAAADAARACGTPEVQIHIEHFTL